MWTDILKLFGAGGGFLVVLGAFVWLIRTVGLALVAEIKALRQDIAGHTKDDLAHHASVRTEMVELRAEVRAALDRRWDEFTPVGGVPVSIRRETPSRGVVTGGYSQVSPRRKRTNVDEE